MKITAITIDHSKQRYDTVGDWLFDSRGNLVVSVSRIKGLKGIERRRCEFLVAIHEMIEAYLCEFAGITDEIVTKWDKEHPNSDEPGYEVGCPYIIQHDIATLIERKLANEMKIDWHKYEEEIQKL